MYWDGLGASGLLIAKPKARSVAQPKAGPRGKLAENRSRAAEVQMEHRAMKRMRVDGPCAVLGRCCLSHVVFGSGSQVFWL